MRRLFRGYTVTIDATTIYYLSIYLLNSSILFCISLIPFKTSSLLSEAIASTIILFTNDIPSIPPQNRTITKYKSTKPSRKLEFILWQIAAGISYQPSIVNNRNVEYRDSRG